MISGFFFHLFFINTNTIKSNLCAEETFHVSANSVFLYFQTPEEYEKSSDKKVARNIYQRIASLDELTEVSSLSVDQITARLLSL